MIRQKIYFVFCFVVLVGLPTYAQKNSVKDFQKLMGSWKGSLTYLDYSSGKPYTMPANLVVTQIGNSTQFIFANSYPNEPSANAIDTITLSADGKYIDKARITSRRIIAHDHSEWVTEEKGKDGNDNKPATFRHTYTLDKNKFTKRKEVQFTDSKHWIKRHEYTYERSGVGK